jgi:hypothetical protein
MRQDVAISPWSATVRVSSATRAAERAAAAEEEMGSRVSMSTVFASHFDPATK